MKNKIVKREQLGEYVSLLYEEVEQPIEYFEDLIKGFKDRGATHINLYINRNWDREIEDIEFTPYKITYETEKEREIRLKQEQIENEQKEINRLKEVEKFEKEQLKRLKEKYEN